MARTARTSSNSSNGRSTEVLRYLHKARTAYLESAMHETVLNTKSWDMIFYEVICLTETDE